MKKNRSSNVELLRIIAMLMIVSFHFVFGSAYNSASLNYNTFIVKIFWYFGELGVNLFMLISGYFICKSQMSWRKLFNLIMQVEFYNILKTIFALKLGWINFNSMSLSQTIMHFLPIINATYWFITCYVIIYLLSPYLNKTVNTLKQADFRKMLLVLLVLYSILPTLFGFLRVGYDLVERMFFYNRFIWLTIVYLIGAYLRNYYDHNKANELKINLKKLVLVAVMVPISIVMFYVLNKKSGFGIELAYFWPPNTILMIILSVVVFKTFLSLKIKSIPAIIFLASASLAVYLLHSGAFAGEMWSKIDSTKYLAGAYPLISVIVTAIIVYLVATVIETFRYKIDKMTAQKLLDSDFFTNRTQNLKKLSKKAETVFDKIFI